VIATEIHLDCQEAAKAQGLGVVSAMTTTRSRAALRFLLAAQNSVAVMDLAHTSTEKSQAKQDLPKKLFS
jgi:hypothetical protein